MRSGEIAQHADLLSFPMRAGHPILRPEHAAVDNFRTSTAVNSV
jgi:hypothetical protein